MVRGVCNSDASIDQRSEGVDSVTDESTFDATFDQLASTPFPLPDTATFSFHQPIGKGGLGFVESTLVVPAARLACLALAASEVQELVEYGVECALVRDRIDTFRALVNAGSTVTDSSDQGCAPDDDGHPIDDCDLVPDFDFELLMDSSPN